MSERKKSNNKIIKRILSGVMAFAIALSMCMVAMPTRVLAAVPYDFWVVDGAIVSAWQDNEQMDGTRSDTTPLTSLDYANSTLIFKSAVNLERLGIIQNGQSISVNGESTISDLSLSLQDVTITVKMSADSTLTINKFSRYDGTETKEMPLEEAQKGGYLKLENGKIEGNKIVYKKDESGDTPTDVKVDEEVQEKGKTAAEAPTYKVTKKDGNTGEITYEKPATDAANVKETEEIPSEVVLGDGNTYKVTKVAKRAFADAPGKEKIKEIKVGENVDEIGEEACKGLPSLEKVTLGKKVKKIDKGAFANCGKLKKADLPADLEEVGESAFERTNLPSAKFGKKVKKVGRKAYYKCKKFKKLTVKSKKLTKKSRVAKNAFAGTNKKFKVKVKISDAKTKAATINVFKQKKIGYKPTWSVN